MTGSFLFVKPSNPNGEPGTAYSDGEPQYSYDHASWEWLLERALRRTLLPWALTMSHSQVILYGHEDQYSMHRWGSYGKSYNADLTPLVGEPGSNSRYTDADLSIDYRAIKLPSSWDSYNEVPTYLLTEVAYGIADLEETVSRLPFSLEWLHPDWSSESLDAWDLEASTTEKTKGTAKDSSDDLEWTWKTTVAHTPYEIPSDVPFKCLSHMRTDDDVSPVSIKDDDNNSIKVDTAPTPASAPRDTDGSVRNFHKAQIRVASLGAAYEAGWALSEFSIPYRHDLDYSASEGSEPYVREGKTTEEYHTVGYLIDLPGKDSKKIAVSYGGEEAKFIPEVDWDGKPTWWHANDFPKGLDSVISPKLKEQLKALCPKCQPAIPPIIPAFHEKFPSDKHLPWEYEPISRPGRPDWMLHFALACTPFDMSARLDAMTTTVHRVPTLFAKIRTILTVSKDYEREATDSISGEGWDYVYESSEKTEEGTSTTPIPTPDPFYEHADTVSTFISHEINDNHSYTAPDSSYSSRSRVRNTEERNLESNSDFLVCLRGTANTTISTKTTIKTTLEKGGTVFDEPYFSETESSNGELPESYDPDPDDYLFPDWILPWIETAELFASVVSSVHYRNGCEDNTTFNSNILAAGGSTYSRAGNGSGTRTHKAKRKFVSLGMMDNSTGRFPALDLAKVLAKVDADPTHNTSSIYTNTTTSTTDEKRNTTTKTVTTRKEDLDIGSRKRSVSYYVVVKWKFDRTDPESLVTDSPTAGLYRDLANAKIALADKERELAAAEPALASAKSDLQSAEDALEHAQKQLANPESAAPDLFAAAQEEIDKAMHELAKAQEKKSSAGPDVKKFLEALQIAEAKLAHAQAVLDAAIATGVGKYIEEAREELDAANLMYSEAAKNYNEMSNKYGDAEAAEAKWQRALDDAKAAFDRLMDEIMDRLNDAVNVAQKAVNKARSRVDQLNQKIERLREEIEKLRDAVEKAEQKVQDATSSGA